VARDTPYLEPQRKRIVECTLCRSCCWSRVPGGRLSYYSAFLATRVAVLDDSRQTPAFEFNDGRTITLRQMGVFRAITLPPSRARARMGRCWRSQFGYLPGPGCAGGGRVPGRRQCKTCWWLAASVRRGGRSLAEIAPSGNRSPGRTTASIAILFVVVIRALRSGRGGGSNCGSSGEERYKLAAGTLLEAPEGTTIDHRGRRQKMPPRILPPGTRLTYLNGGTLVRSEGVRHRRRRLDRAAPGNTSVVW